MKTERPLLLAIVFSSVHPDYTAQDVGNIHDSGSRELDAGFPGLFSHRDGV